VSERKFKIGDLIHEQHFPDRKGVVIGVTPDDSHRPSPLYVVVEWVGLNPNSASSGPEKIEERYLILLSRKEK